MLFLEYIVGFALGYLVCFIVLFIRNHREHISYSLTTIKEDIVTLHVKVDNVFDAVKLLSSHS